MNIPNKNEIEINDSEYNILINENEEDHFNIAFKLMLNCDNDKFIGGILEDSYVNEIKSESKPIEIKNSFSSEKESKQTSKAFGRSKSVCKILAKIISLDMDEKSKSCKFIKKIN
jgi:hypothetical protein